MSTGIVHSIDGTSGGEIFWIAEEQIYDTTEDLSTLDEDDAVTFTISDGAATSVAAA